MYDSEFSLRLKYGIRFAMKIERICLVLVKPKTDHLKFRIALKFHWLTKWIWHSFKTDLKHCTLRAHSNSSQNKIASNHRNQYRTVNYFDCSTCFEL